MREICSRPYILHSLEGTAHPTMDTMPQRCEIRTCRLRGGGGNIYSPTYRLAPFTVKSVPCRDEVIVEVCNTDENLNTNQAQYTSIQGA